MQKLYSSGWLVLLMSCILLAVCFLQACSNAGMNRIAELDAHVTKNPLDTDALDELFNYFESGSEMQKYESMRVLSLVASIDPVLTKKVVNPELKERVVKKAIMGLHNSSELVRQISATALRSNAGEPFPEALPIIVRHLEDPNVDQGVFHLLCDAVSNYGQNACMYSESLGNLITSRHPWKYDPESDPKNDLVGLLKKLYRHCPESILPILERASKDANPAVRSRADEFAKSLKKPPQVESVRDAVIDGY